jgi:chitodextrinase
MSSVPSLVVSEIMYHPAISTADEAAGFSENDFEFLEIINTGSETVSLSGIELVNAVDFRFEAIAIAPGQAMVVVGDRAGFERRYGTDRFVAGEFTGTLGNGSDRIRVLLADGNELLDFQYDDAWHPTTDGSGPSLHLADTHAAPTDWEDPAVWRASLSSGGSPGAADTLPPSAPEAAPDSLTANILSVRHVELTWQWSIPDSSEFLIYRNGHLLATTEGRSFVDDSATPGRIDRYQVAASDALGNSSPTSLPMAVTIALPGGDPAFAAPTAEGVVSDPDLLELSGLAASQRNPEVFWANNDGAGGNRVFALGSDGHLLATLFLDGVVSIDWEDIATGPGPVTGQSYVYVGDIGDNQGERDHVIVYRFAEPDLNDTVNGQMIIPASSIERLTFQYPNGGRDAEVLMSDPVSGDLLIVAKESSPSRVYRAAANQLPPGAMILLTEIGTVELSTPSGGDISPDGREILLRNEDKAVVYARAAGMSLADALTGQAFSAPVVGTPEEPNGEAIAYDRLGSAYFTISEGANPVLYRFARTSPAAAGDANQDGVFNSSDLVRVFQTGKYETSMPALWSEGDWNGDGYFTTSDLVFAFQRGGYSAAATIASASTPNIPLMAAVVDEIFAPARRRK